MPEAWAGHRDLLQAEVERWRFGAFQSPYRSPREHAGRWTLCLILSALPRKFRILAINDDCCRDNLCLVGDTSISGFRVAEASNGFQLVEHGIWKRPKYTALPPAVIVKAGRIHLPYSYAKSPSERPPGFRRASYLPHVYAAETQYGLPAGLLGALVWTESRYNPLAINKAGAAGLGQLMPETARDLGITNRFDPMANIFGAAQYLRQMLDRFGAVHLAIAAYNAGPGAVERAGGIPHNGETPAYVRDVLHHWRF